ncbi:hypothetical protein QBC42DRAFT_282589 [Cladorrhinum samala]|uniref:Uncharacterized protein n=1 Tax=Cladorrhinum samala TaxID=585594 RepID=A0AAV9HZA6_9PEZI|nr:hypothetical protein QBC42DRAFT_282589 [Cladorrhinum samala]
MDLFNELGHGQQIPRNRVEIFQHVLSVICRYGVNYAIDIFRDAQLDFDVIRGIPMALIAASKSEALTQASNHFITHLRALLGIRHDYDIDIIQVWDKMERVTAANAIPQMECRLNAIVSDKLAILANMIRYRERIAMEQHYEQRYGFSICTITLALINGDINPFNNKYHFPSNHDDITTQSIATQGVWYYRDNSELLSKTMPQFLLDWDNLNPPWNNPLGGRPYYPNVQAHPTGLQIHGWVWQVQKRLSLRKITRHYQHLLKGPLSLTGPEEALSSACKAELRNFF